RWGEHPRSFSTPAFRGPPQVGTDFQPRMGREAAEVARAGDWSIDTTGRATTSASFTGTALPSCLMLSAERQGSGVFSKPFLDQKWFLITSYLLVRVWMQARRPPRSVYRFAIPANQSTEWSTPIPRMPIHRPRKLHRPLAQQHLQVGHWHGRRVDA